MSVREVEAALALDGCGLLRRNAYLEVEEVFRVVLPLYCNHQLKIARIVVSEERLTSLRRLRIWNKVLVGEIDERALGTIAATTRFKRIKPLANWQVTPT